MGRCPKVSLSSSPTLFFFSEWYHYADRDTSQPVARPGGHPVAQITFFRYTAVVRKQRLTRTGRCSVLPLLQTGLDDNQDGSLVPERPESCCRGSPDELFLWLLQMTLWTSLTTVWLFGLSRPWGRCTFPEVSLGKSWSTEQWIPSATRSSGYTAPMQPH